jgi:hypothetical protein
MLWHHLAMFTLVGVTGNGAPGVSVINLIFLH